MTRSHGFTVIEIVLVIVTLAIIAGVGYVAYTNLGGKQADTATYSPSPAPKESIDSSSTDIKDQNDLDNVDKQLDALEIDNSTDSSQFDSYTNEF